MSEKPKRVVIHYLETLKKLAGATLEFDIAPGERICGACGGIGVVKRTLPYGPGVARLQGRLYQNQILAPCPNCHHGTVKVCPHCGADIPVRVRQHCCCDAAVRAREEARRAKDRDAYEKARRIEPDTAEALAMGMLFYEGAPNEGFVHDMDEFLDWWETEHAEEDARPEYIWGTKPVRLIIDAQRIVEQACENLHEDAIDSISNEDMTRLENFLDEWCGMQDKATSYLQDDTVLVRVPWEDLA